MHVIRMGADGSLAALAPWHRSTARAADRARTDGEARNAGLAEIRLLRRSRVVSQDVV